MDSAVPPPLEVIADAAPALIAYLDRDQRFRWCNRLHEVWLGRAVDDLIGRSLREVLGEAPYSEVKAYVQRVLEGERVAFEHRIPSARPKARWAQAEYAPHRDADGAVVGFVAVLLDVTERRQREEAVRTSETMLHAFLDKSPNVAYAKDLDGRYILVSQSYAELFGTTKDALLGKTDYERFPREVADYYVTHDRAVLESRQPREFEEVGQIGGEMRTYISVKFPLLDAAGEPWCICGISTDITKLKEHERRLMEADRRKDEFLAMLAHELRNPLAPIRNVVDALRLQPQVPPERLRWALDMLDRQATHLSRLVGDLLDVARITTGRITLHHEPVDLAGVVRIALDNVRVRAQEQGIRLEVQLPGEEVVVIGDHARLVQVVDNLVDNALKYTDEGGRIDVILQRSEGEARLRVRDTGMGIDANVLPRIFELFGQGESTLARSKGGLGLGLSLVRRLLMLMGGSVEAYSEGVGRGSEFVVRMELAQHECCLEEPSPPAAGQLSRRVLVVEDKEDVAASIANLLSVLGHQPCIAADAHRALMLLDEFDPEIALVDIGLPGMDGYELARRLRATYPALRLIAVSGYADDGARRASHEAGFERHLGKPLGLAELTRALEG